MLFQWYMFFVVLRSITAYVNFEHLDFITNPKLLRLNVEIKNVSNLVVLSLDVNLLKEIDGKLMIKFAIYKETPEKLNQIFSLPKNNYCTLLRNSNNIPFIKDFFKQVARFGNIPMNCPIRKGNYFLENFEMTGMSTLPAGFDSGKYQVHFKLIDENEKVPSLTIGFKAYLNIN